MIEAKQEHMILRMAAGDDQAWSQFVEVLGPKIQKALGKVTEDQEAKEDAVSQILLDIVTVFADVGRQEANNTKE